MTNANFIHCYVEFQTTLENANRIYQDSGYTEEDVEDGTIGVSLAGVPFPGVPRKGEELVVYPNAERGAGQGGEVTLYGKVSGVRYQATMFKKGGFSACSVWVTLEEVEVK